MDSLLDQTGATHKEIDEIGNHPLKIGSWLMTRECWQLSKYFFICGVWVDFSSWTIKWTGLHLNPFLLLRGHLFAPILVYNQRTCVMIMQLSYLSALNFSSKKIFISTYLCMWWVTEVCKSREKWAFLSQTCEHLDGCSMKGLKLAGERGRYRERKKVNPLSFSCILGSHIIKIWTV